MAPMFSADIDSNRSAPRPAQSPTLSPTRSATTAAFRGSSSWTPSSTLPTTAAPPPRPPGIPCFEVVRAGGGVLEVGGRREEHPDVPRQRRAERPHQEGDA